MTVLMEKGSKRYTLESLKEINQSYNQEHRLTHSDVNTVNEMIELIENSRSTINPKIGDMVQFTNRYGEYYSSAHIDSQYQGDPYICERPSQPFVYANDNGDGICTSTSGGAWTYIPYHLQYVGSKEKAFRLWGHFGPCGNGAVYFFANVSVWNYTEGEHLYTTKTHDKFHVSICENDPDGYQFIISKGGSSHRVFRKEKEYQAWLKTYHGVEEEGHSPKAKKVWTYKQTSKCIPLEEYHAIKNAVIDSELCNGRIQECKRIYEGTTVQTFLPYQNDKIELSGVKEYMRAYKLEAAHNTSSENN